MKLVISAVAAATVLSALPATAAPSDTRVSTPRTAKAVVTASATTVTEGDRVRLKARIPKAADAKRVVLQERAVSVFGGFTWTDLTSRRASRRVVFRRTVTAQNQAVYRVAVTYRDRAKPVMSKPVSLEVWRWVPLKDFPAYFTTSSLIGVGTDTVNGSAYQTWGLHYTISSPRAWEARITLGRNCTAFRGVLGLSDRSDDGSSGSISLAVDEAATIYTSPTLTPGMSMPVELHLARPYRFSLSAANTSTDTIKAFPMVGNGAFYCTGIDG